MRKRPPLPYPRYISRRVAKAKRDDDPDYPKIIEFLDGMAHVAHNCHATTATLRLSTHRAC